MTPLLIETTPTTHLIGVFRALADETRLNIVRQLEGGERCVCELTSALGVPQSLLSHHLKTLKEAGLLAHRRDGRWSHYRLNPDGLSVIEAYLGGLRLRAETSQGSSSGSTPTACCEPGEAHAGD